MVVRGLKGGKRKKRRKRKHPCHSRTKKGRKDQVRGRREHIKICSRRGSNARPGRLEEREIKTIFSGRGQKSRRKFFR